MRRDAQDRRERLITAAAALFQCHGYHVALEAIAAEAGVGRATLYRNFADRRALALAVFERQLAVLAQDWAATGGDPAAFYPFLCRIARQAVLHGPLIASLEAEEDGPALIQGLHGQLDAVLAPPLASAQAAGLVRADLTVVELHRAAKMLVGAAERLAVEAQEQALAEALALLVEGLRPR
ncbi:TetR family transcriptional regulator [Nitrospirillum amazonense]|uniref:TetR family transcriptional regulator n=1 Tax=Nitrospirillum amazonense TaxID=28077 RepID=A0A560JFL1_9PROT|nr:TetR/AcrR family transcriptional regulator [Nitrospirillum amazonense]TWB69942.1 TetR family transcriptional regulator [Nitrospirillum amazonense]